MRTSPSCMRSAMPSGSSTRTRSAAPSMRSRWIGTPSNSQS
jgi:hypothetical protein